jgi:hypothetical protein
MLNHSKTINLLQHPSPNHSPLCTHWSFTSILLIYTLSADPITKAKALKFYLQQRDKTRTSLLQSVSSKSNTLHRWALLMKMLSMLWVHGISDLNHYWPQQHNLALLLSSLIIHDFKTLCCYLKDWSLYHYDQQTSSYLLSIQTMLSKNQLQPLRLGTCTTENSWPSTIPVEQIFFLYVSQTFLPPSAHFWSFYLSLSLSTTTPHSLLKNEIPITHFFHHLTFFSTTTVISTLNVAPCLLIQVVSSSYFGRNYLGSTSHRLH